MTTANRECNCANCGSTILVGQPINWIEATYSKGRTNGGYGSKIQIKTGKFKPVCTVCNFDDLISTLNKKIDRIQLDIDRGNSAFYGELEQDKKEIDKLRFEIAYYYCKFFKLS